MRQTHMNTHTHTYIITVLIVSKSLYGFVVNQVQYIMDGLVSLFNGMLTFVGYLMPKPFY